MHRPTGIRRAAMALGTTLLATLGASLFGTQRAYDLIKNPSGNKAHRRQRAHLFNSARAAQRRNDIMRDRRERPEHYAFQGAVAKLTNWERNQWARAGYPGLRQEDISKVLQFNGREIGRKIMALRESAR